MVRRRDYNEDFVSELTETPSPNSEVVNASGNVKSLKKTKRSIWAKAYSLFHSILALFALFVAFKCNNGFKALPFLAACCCPQIFLIYVAATRGLGFCLKDKSV